MKKTSKLRRRPSVHALSVALPLAIIASNALAQNVDLGNLGTRGFVINGIDTDDRSGFSVSGAGDVNGDGLGDLIIGAFDAEDGGDIGAGESYVVFGKAGTTAVDLGALASGGFVINGIDTDDLSGFSVSGAGDVNGDGLADLIVGACGADPGGVGGAGESYVVFGKASPTPVDLSALGNGGFVITGIDTLDRSGENVSGAGDVNGDGLADLIIGAFGADAGGNTNAGESYVVFGKASTTPVDLGALGSGGFVIGGIDDSDLSGNSVSGAGDVNGDGLADLIVGANGADPAGDLSAGESYVVFGKASTTPVDLSALGTRGFVINGVEASDFLGSSVSGAGDVNGDGFGDLIVGAPGAVNGTGESYVVFGKASATPVDLGVLGLGGFVIYGIDIADSSGYSVSGAGDINGDGLADLVIGAFGADPGDDRAGESYVLLGKASTAAVNLSALGAGGFVMAGIDVFDGSGVSVSGAGDVNGDGLGDLIVGASGADAGGDSNAGESYVVFSTATAPLSAQVRVRSANSNPARTAFGISGDGSNDNTPDARAWINFTDGNDPVASASTETMNLTRTAGALPSPGASVSWQLQSTRQNWTNAELKLLYLNGELIGDENALQIVYSPNGMAPFTPLASVVNPLNNTISANITGAGYFYLGYDLFANGFE